jgi:hypothetical protein
MEGDSEQVTAWQSAGDDRAWCDRTAVVTVVERVLSRMPGSWAARSPMRAYGNDQGRADGALVIGHLLPAPVWRLIRPLCGNKTRRAETG